MDWMHIRDLKIRCIIGTRPVERRRKQTVIVNISLECDLSKAGRNDRLEDTVNYKRLRDDVVEHVEKSKYLLIEKLAESIAAICNAVPKVKSARVVVDKPGALASAQSAAVEIVRRRRER